MKAMVYRENGGPKVLRCEEVEPPTPADHQVSIEFRAASINPLDWRLMHGRPGTFAVQIARTFGAAVTGVCSTRNESRHHDGNMTAGVGLQRTDECSGMPERGPK